MRSDEEKFQTVINKNTFFFLNVEFEEEYEGYITSIINLLLVLKSRIDEHGLKKETLTDFIVKKDEGLTALLTLLGISKETLLRLITIIRIIQDPELKELVNKSYWPDEPFETEWSESKIRRLIKSNQKFAEGLINLFLEGAANSKIRSILPLFELKKFGITKLNFSLESLVDTIVRYKTKGSRSGKKERNPEILIEGILSGMDILHVKGNLDGVRRRMDFIIPDRSNPLIIIEASYEMTTGSGMGDKAKTEIEVSNDIKKAYHEATFIGFVDGIGWYVRQGDLMRMVQAFDDVFTFQDEELIRFTDLVKERLV